MPSSRLKQRFEGFLRFAFVKVRNGIKPRIQLFTYNISEAPGPSATITHHETTVKLMNSFYQKSEAAHQKIESGDFSLRENALGEMVPEKPYHVMYSPDFKGYFTYMVLCEHGPLDEHKQHTSWGFDYYDESEDYSPYYRKAPADYEHCLSPTEVVAWLEKGFGNLLDADDYQYLINILETAHHPYSEPSYQKNLALKWLREKLEQASVPATALPDLGLQWNAPRTEFVELIYALFESGALTITLNENKSRAKAIERLGAALHVEGKDKVDSVLQMIKKRNSDRQTPLLDRLKESLLAYLRR